MWLPETEKCKKGIKIHKNIQTFDMTFGCYNFKKIQSANKYLKKKPNSSIKIYNLIN